MEKGYDALMDQARDDAQFRWNIHSFASLLNPDYLGNMVLDVSLNTVVYLCMGGYFSGKSFETMWQERSRK